MIDKGKIYRVSRAGLSRGVGGASREATQMVMEDKVVRASRNISDRISKRNAGQNLKTAKKMTGIFFWIILAMNIFEDILDIVLDATGFLAVVTSVTSIILLFINFTYMFFQRVDFGSRKLILWGISFIVELIPGADILPTYSVVFVLTRFMENNEKFKKALQTVQAKKIVRPKRGS